MRNPELGTTVTRYDVSLSILFTELPVLARSGAARAATCAAVGVLVAVERHDALRSSERHRPDGNSENTS
jgi:hypothetical protein